MEKHSKVLIVDDSKAITQFLGSYIEEQEHMPIEIAGSLQEVEGLLARDDERFFVAVLDLNLPDAPNGEVVDFVLARKIPVIVLTGFLSDELRDQMLEKRVVDYVMKSNASEINHVAEIIRRIRDNRDIKVLVVDDSRSFRQYVVDLLHVHRYRIYQAADGVEALEVLQEQPDLSLVLTDYHMPRMDGMDLISEIRRRYGRNELAIIGVSDRASPLLSARLLKTGANDFVTKPFMLEEFYCRVNQNIETISHIRAIRESAIRDYLTKVYNRRYLFEAGLKLFENARRKNISLVAAMVDIDYFKRINDSYGHHTGDVALQRVAAVLEGGIRASDLLGRYGGEEFCILATNVSEESHKEFFDRIRQKVADIRIPHKGEEIAFTVSIGVTDTLGESLEQMIGWADEALYRAKQTGRNRVVFHGQE
ncbi:MAG: diguanylate cyclase [Gammaproteobacteria bacterium]|nr:diguanylate cyclase [Gammaproteobacteria bacterium]MBU1655311.1 diguanylate cyclase [Gammaproteobacteria bacterium]MBU1961456.1 diguanylate cyclase [Gammaproteobacteria bacterium]